MAMRILMTNYEYPPLGGGAGRLTHGLAMRLVRAGDRVDLLTMGSPGLSPLEEIDGVRVMRVPTQRRDPAACTIREAAQYLARAMPRMGALVRDGRYSVIHSHFVFPDGLLARRAAGLAGLRYLITAHGTDVPGHNPHRMRSLHRLLVPIWRGVTTRAATVVCPSKVLASRVTRVNPRARVTVIPNAFDAARFTPRAERVPRILTVSRMIPLKGVQYLIEALQQCEYRGEVVFVGDGPYADTLKRLAHERHVPVSFTGWIANESSELRELYETSEIFVFPSEAENCPLVLLEAMAAGLAIVTTSDEGCRGLVADTALVVPPRDPVALARAIGELAGDPELRQRLGSAARRRVVERFGWDALIAGYRGLYERHAL